MAGYNSSNWWDAPTGGAGQAGNPLSSLFPITGGMDPSASIGGGVGALAGGGGDQSWLRSSGVLDSIGADGSKLQGWGMPALGLASGLTNAFFGYKQYQLAKDTLQNNKDQFKLNFDAQKKTTNAALSDRQNARVAANPGAYQSVGEYMQKNGI